MRSFSKHRRRHGNRYFAILVNCLLGFLLLLQDIRFALTDDSFVSKQNTKSIWYDAFNSCRHAPNQTLPSYEMMETRNWTEIRHLLPVWVFGFEVGGVNGSNKFYTISSLEIDRTAGAKCFSSSGIAENRNKTYEQAQQFCSSKNMTLYTYQTMLNLNRVGSDTYKGTNMWLDGFNSTVVGTFINEDGQGQVRIRCLIFDENGALKADNCSKKYNSVCFNETIDTSSVVRYIGNVSLPTYDQNSGSSGANTTGKDTSGTSFRPTSGSSSNTKSTSGSGPTWISNSTSSYENKRGGFNMDKDLIIALITVGSAVLLAIVLAICCCCCCKNSDSKRKRKKKAHLAENYSETADSITFKDSRIYDNNVECGGRNDGAVNDYATPEDAVGMKRARQRDSIAEGEYDTLHHKPQDSNKKKVAIVNAYSHVAIVAPNIKGDNVTSYDENQYDVTSLSKPVTVAISANESGGNIYGHMDTNQV